MRWLIAGGVLLLAVAVATVVSGALRRFIDAPARDERRRQLAEPAGRFVYSGLVAAGLVAALGIASPESLKPLPLSLVSFLPRLLISGLLLLLGGTVATMAANAIGSSLLRATGRPQPALTRMVRASVMAVIAILAVSQLGVNTKIVDTITEAVVFGCAAAMVLLIGLGGRNVASEVAAGRYVRKLVRVGDRLECGGVGGTVVHVHAVTIELSQDDGSTLHVAHARLIADPLRIDRPAPGEPSSPTA